MRIFGLLGVFFRYFRGILGVNSGSPEFRAGGHFSWKFRVGPFRGSVAGRGRSQPKTGGFPPFSGKVQIVSRTLSGLFLVGALNRPRKRKRTNREIPRTIPEQIGKIPEKSGKSQKGQKKDKLKK